MDMSKLNVVINRIYSDYFMPSRLPIYEEILKKAISLRYNIVTVRDFCLNQNEYLPNSKIFINRHDIDTDIPTAKEFFKIEQRLGIKASYYFRTTTFNVDFCRQLENFGSEASYHFEEIATYCKKYHIKTNNEAINALSMIKKTFEDNFNTFQATAGYKLVTVASHGDFVNRFLKLANHEITKDDNLRKKLGILAETYDSFKDSFFYISDRSYPEYFYPIDPFKAMENKEPLIYMLTHPRQWRHSFKHNTIDNIKRLFEGIKYKL